MSRFKIPLFGSTPHPTVEVEPPPSTLEPDVLMQVAPDPITEETAAPDHPTRSPQGKLGLVLTRLTSPAGATIDELAEETGWQSHTLRAAISRLRRKGYRIEHSANAGGSDKAYRLVSSEG